MADNYRKNNRDDIDDFFAQFDQPAKNQPRRTSGSTSRRSGSPAAQRSQDRPASDGRKTSSAHTNSSNSRRNNASRSHSQSRSTQITRQNSSSKNTVNSTMRKTNNSRGGSRPRKPQSHGKKFLKLAVLICLAIIMGVGTYVGIVIATAPKVDTDNIYDMLSQRSIMYDADGNEIENLYFSDGNRTVIKYDDIPEDMVNAVISIEDKKFWKHNGFNFIRMAGAIKDSLFSGGQISGTSTVTQQLARNVYLSDIKSQRSLSRKITEAYYTIIIEKNLSKEQIMEAYLNTISLGFNSYGIQAASQAYFSKDAKDLTTLECAALAALPKSPSSYALVKANYDGNTTSSLPVISSSESVTYLYNGDLSKPRRDMTITNMAEEGYITTEEKDKALSDDLKKHIQIGVSSDADESSYFTDFAIDQLTDDIIEEYGISRADARDMIYSNGLKIYTTMDSDIQNVVEEEFAKDSNFSGVSYVRRNSEGDILNESGKIMLYDYSHYFNKKNEFTLKKSEYKINGDGSMTIYAGKRLNIYDVEVNGNPDVSIQFKGMYTQEKGSFYFIESGALSIPQGYTTTDGDGNAVVSAKFFKDYPDFFEKSKDDYIVKDGNYSLKQKIRQPQAATVIMENSTGEIKAMMGGRGAKGKQLFNRATSPRQPGSSIKPIAVYGPALQMSYEYAQDNKTMKLDTSEGSNWGKYITAGSVINDQPIKYNGRSWPKNWYSGFKGHMTLRTAVEQSVNTASVKTYQQIGPDYSASILKKSGVTSLDEEGKVNDLNPAALALGGMTNGISPLEVTAAYAIFPNGGIYKEPISYTKVLNSNDEILFENKSDEERVYDEGVAWIMTDILRTAVTRGICGAASIGSQPVAGKTGTTSDSYDLWFAGFTPQYTAAMWMGNDINIELSAGSSASASFWADIMRKICADLPRGSFKEKPSNVITVNGEYYIDGTYSKVSIKKTDRSDNESSGSTSTESTIQKPSSETNSSVTKPPTTSPPTSPTTPTEEQP